MKTKMYRQGDVMIERVDALPAKRKKAGLENGRVILAHGEVTGHAHSFEACDAKKFESENGVELFEVTGRPLKFRLPVVRQWRNQVMVRHPELGLIEFAVDDVVVKEGNVRVNGNFGLLGHQEHSVQAITGRNAVASTWGKRGEDYCPAVET